MSLPIDSPPNPSPAPSLDPSFDPATAALPALAAHIVATHHAFCRSELPALIAALRAAIPQARPEEAPELRQLLGGFDNIAGALLQHLMKEETLLFPLITAIDTALRRHAPPPRSTFGSVGNPIRMMVLEHSEAEVLLAKLRQTTHGFQAPAGATPATAALYERVRAFDADMQRHVELEDKFLFPRAIAVEKEAAGPATLGQ